MLYGSSRCGGNGLNSRGHHRFLLNFLLYFHRLWLLLLLLNLQRLLNSPGGYNSFLDRCGRHRRRRLTVHGTCRKTSGIVWCCGGHRRCRGCRDNGFNILISLCSGLFRSLLLLFFLLLFSLSLFGCGISERLFADFEQFNATLLASSRRPTETWSVRSLRRRWRSESSRRHSRRDALQRGGVGHFARNSSRPQRHCGCRNLFQATLRIGRFLE